MARPHITSRIQLAHRTRRTHRPRHRGVILPFLVGLLLPGILAAAPAMEVISDGDGRLVRNVTPTDGPVFPPPHPGHPDPMPPHRDGTTLWVDTQHQNAVAERVAISGDGMHAMAGWWLNNQRVSLYAMIGAGAPEWSHAMPAAQFTISVDADDPGETFTATAREESLFVFDAASPTPGDSHPYPTPILGYVTGVADDGSTYAASGANAAQTDGEVFVYDGSGGLQWSAAYPGVPQGVCVSADGQVVANTVRAFVMVWDALTGAVRDSIAIVGETQVGAVLSGDGTYLATGGFHHRVNLYAWNGSSYVFQWAHVIPSTTWLTALAISDDGSTIAAGTWTNPTGGQVVMFDTGSSTPLWTDSAFGDYVSSVALTDDGTRLAAGSWGRLEGTFGPIVAVYDRTSSTPIFAVQDDELPDVGSCQGIDISEDGRRVIAGGKRVHARTFGHGGFVLAIDVSDPVAVAETPAGPATLLRAAPNPFRFTTRIVVGGPTVTGDVLRIVGTDGRELRVMRVDARGEVRWDGRDARGRRVAPGVYHARLETTGGPTRSVSRPIVFLR